MGKNRRWTPEEDAVLLEFYMPAPKGRRYLSAYKKLPGRTKDGMSARARYCGLVSGEKTRVITKFLHDAAEQGWRMVPEEATEEMVEAGCEEHESWADPARGETIPGVYRSMCEAAPKFEWDK